MISKVGWANRGQVTSIRGGVVGGVRVRDPVGDRQRSQGHGVEGLGE
jgi:hypothetical protein